MISLTDVSLSLQLKHFTLDQLSLDSVSMKEAPAPTFADLFFWDSLHVAYSFSLSRIEEIGLFLRQYRLLATLVLFIFNFFTVLVSEHKSHACKAHVLPLSHCPATHSRNLLGLCKGCGACVCTNPGPCVNMYVVNYTAAPSRIWDPVAREILYRT